MPPKTIKTAGGNILRVPKTPRGAGLQNLVCREYTSCLP